ncbi:OPT family oligopeptide transporter [Anaeromyxobacter sp. Fw109-5]|uniref:OPT family oligopeptide transporter n=1 Tax=Anaeromyxobacter sp. (strain Fw109-5) TaxID=404589 RepID=UPI0000ED8BA7|nr:OPT family oligopeptide transporter [Anaeromyxobacter sp. Fw109-5]ABS27146.1 oligopeptide transporter, OPT superfamily [Anaeromyxobacter sp. Fw109-5]
MLDVSAPPGPEDPERRWLAEVYQPDARQLTLRAALAGCALGAVMALSNLYVILKTGWSLGVTITACILAFAFFRAARAAGLARTEFGPLENNAMASVASSAGYMTGGGNMAALPALLMLTGARPDALPLVAWFATIAALGVFVAIPIKRQLVNREQLPFPTGTATAETIRALHGDASSGKARLLGGAALLGAALAWLKDAPAAWTPLRLPATLGLPFSIAGLPAARWGLAAETSLLLVGSGALVSFRTGWSMLLGAFLTYGVLAPAMVARGAIEAVTYRAIVQWTLWGGAALLVSSGLLTFALQWRSVVASLGGLGRAVRGGDRGDPLAAVEAPASWFVGGLLVLGPAVVLLMRALFGIPLWVGALTVPLAVVLGFMAARITGETDTTPTKAFGPLTQLLYGGLLPGQLVPNLMGANVTGGIGLHAADLLTDLKSGYLLGARPRPQLAAQLLGTIVGAAAIVPVFDLLVPDASVLGSEKFPAPASQVWAGVSRVLAAGVGALHPTARVAIAAGAALGAALVLLERLLPARARAFVPTASGLGLAMVIPGTSSIAIFVGATLADALRRTRPALADAAVLPVASGLIAGESLMGIVVAIVLALGLGG